MINLLRASIIFSLLALVATAAIPLDQSYEVTIRFDRLPPLPMVAAFCALLVVLLQAVSAYGLLRFRRWAPKVAAFTTVLLAGLALMVALASDLASAIPVTGKAMFFASVASWAAAVLLTTTPRVKQRFRIAP